MDLSQKFGLKNQLLVDLDAHIFFREWMDRLEWHASWWKVCSALPLCCERHNLNVFVLYFLTYLQTRVRGLIGTSWLGQVTSASLYCNYQNESDSRKTWVPNLPIRLNIWFFSFFWGFIEHLNLVWRISLQKISFVGSRDRQRARVPDRWAREVAGSPVSHQTSSCVINIWIAQFTVKHVQFGTMVWLKCKPKPPLKSCTYGQQAGQCFL
jgi:hypothetical protein